MNDRTVKLLAWLIGTVLFTAGMTLELPQGWSLFLTNLGSSIGFGVGVNISMGTSSSRRAPPPLPVIALIALSLGGCGALPPSAVWPLILECSPGVSDIVGVVSRILLNGRVDENELGASAKRELQQLAIDHGADAVACTIEHLVRRWRDPGGASTPETMAASVRGESFLYEVGVR